MRLLFIGDSITDAGRKREDPTNLGTGYVSEIQKNFPQFECFNRGISGNRVDDVESRLTEAFEATRPDCLTVYVGVNDVMHWFKRWVPFRLNAFRESYSRLLDTAQRCRPKYLCLIEPFVLPVLEGDLSVPHLVHAHLWDDWREKLDPAITVIRTFARERAIPLIPLDGLFAAECTWTPPSLIAGDGVHLSELGHKMLAQFWTDGFAKRALPDFKV